MNARADWRAVLEQPALGDHIVQVYQDREFLAEAVAEYIGAGLQRGEGAILIARPGHLRAFEHHLAFRGCRVQRLIEDGQLRMLDAQATLELFMRGGEPQWQAFHEAVGGVIAEMRLRFPTVRAYGEMVDLLWQDGRRDAAIRLEEFWNDLARLQTFSLFCAYFMDNLDAGSYGGPLECVCKVHTHLIPARDYGAFDEKVSRASRKVLDEPLSRMMFHLAEEHRPSAEMPKGQAVLFWLQKNMPRTAERVLQEVRSQA
ncbi:MAG: MEDS domain-containing protein [Betaproteobacteria bacterium]